MFTFKLEKEDGTPAEPATLARGSSELESRRPNPSGARTLRVVEVRPVSGPLDDPVLVVREDAA